MEQSAKAKEGAAEALRGVAKLASSGAQVSVDDVSARLQARSDVADEKFTRAMGAVDESTDNDLAEAQAEARLAARRARLQGSSKSSSI